ncbi:MAG: Hpt domain-containing protein [Parvibaculum sp.]|nr:Hpt domain-containing protein [Parvibaculum sp.]
MGTTRDEDVADYDKLISRAEAAVEALRDTYRQQLADDVVALDGIWSRFGSDEPAAALLDELYGIAHNVKGQGGSFGYDLVTEIGASLCNYLRSGSRVSPEERNIVHIHIRMLKTVSENNIFGTGGETGMRIVEKLRVLTGSGGE